MTLIRFMKERARQIVFDQDPGFKVVSYEQVELKGGVYMCKAIIQELGTGKYFRSSFQAGTSPYGKTCIKPYEQDEPVFEEIEVNHRASEKFYEIIKNC